MTAEGFSPEHALVSASLRTRETWESVASGAGWDLDPDLDRGFYAADVESALKSPEVANAILSAGAEPAEGTPEEFGRFINEEIAKWGRLQEQMARQKR